MALHPCLRLRPCLRLTETEALCAASAVQEEVHLLQEESKDSDTKGQVQAIIDALDAQVAQ